MPSFSWVDWSPRQVVPPVDLRVGGLDVVVDVVSRSPTCRHPRLAWVGVRTPAGLEAEVEHPLRLALHPRHLPHDRLVEAPLGLEDVVLLVIHPREYLGGRGRPTCGGAPSRGGVSGERTGSFSYGDSNNGRCHRTSRRSTGGRGPGRRVVTVTVTRRANRRLPPPPGLPSGLGAARTATRTT